MNAGTPGFELDRRHNEIANMSLIELRRAGSFHSAMHSAHEGYAVLLEEVDELWEQVKFNPKTEPERRQRVVNMRKEAIQIAAMAMRFVHDICDKEPA